MKRYRIKNKFRFTAFVTVCLLVLAFAGGSILGLYDAKSKDKVEYISVKVEYGDTLWNLAKEYGPNDKDVREVIYEICQINNITADTLQAGQYIVIPN